MMKTLAVIASLCLCLGFASPVAAQVVPDVNNPSAVVWTPAADHAQIDGYTLDILNSDGTFLKSLDLGKPTPDPITGECRAPLNVQSIKFGQGYMVRLYARAGTAYSDYALGLNKFNRISGHR